MTDTTAKPASPAAARTRLMLEGPIVATLLRLAVPNLVVNVVLIAVTPSVDAHFVGRLGLDALAGLALVFPLMMLMQQMANMAMGGAIAASIARAIGAGRREDAASLVIHALAIAARRRGAVQRRVPARRAGASTACWAAAARSSRRPSNIPT